jgi:hypothetical protein
MVTLTSVTTITHIIKVSATEEDVTPPVLNDIWVSPSVISDGESITIYANVTDDISGINFVFPTVQSESGNQWIQFGGLNYNSSSGLWEKVVTIPQYSEAGIWTIPYVECGDFVENRAFYKYGTDYIAKFTVNSLTPDTKPDTEPTAANATQISISVDTSSTVVGSAVNIYGILTDINGNPLPNKSVTLSYSVTDNDWVPIGSGITNAAGQYYIQWINTASGTFTLKAEWIGDDKYLGTSATTTLTSLPYQDPYIFYIESNSTITALTFDATESELVFTASGASGTTGYVKATIPKDLLYTEGNWSVLVDENPIIPTVNEDANKTYLHFTYGHSIKTIKIRGTEATPDFPSWTLMLLILIALAVAIAIYIKKTSRTNAETNHNQLLRSD